MSGFRSDVAVYGAGVLGRLLALELRRRGASVILVDAGDEAGRASCSFLAAGLLSPFCERDSASERISRLGKASLELWPRILKGLDPPVFFRREGSVVVALPEDRAELERLRRRAGGAALDEGRRVDRAALARLEPELQGRFSEGLFFPNEGQIDNREFLVSSGLELRRAGVVCRFGERAEPAERPGGGWVVDCRGMGARHCFSDLRGVRGEMVHVEAPEVGLSRPVRLIHPRFPLYIAPRRRDRYVIGATQLESEDTGPITVRSTLELLSAAFTVHSGFAEGRVVETVTGLRPAFPDHEPRLTVDNGLLRVNGLFRHGFLVSPRVAQWTADLLEGGGFAATDGDISLEVA